MARARQFDFIIPGFVDNSNNRLALGTITFYVPGTTNLKDIWEDADKVVLSANPVTLNDQGSFTAFGDGIYDVLVKDDAGTTFGDFEKVECVSSLIAADLIGIDVETTYGTRDAQAIIDAISDAGGDPATLILTPENWTIDQNFTVPSNIKIVWNYGAYWTNGAGINVNFNGRIKGDGNIFRGAGTVTIDTNANSSVLDEWTNPVQYGRTFYSNVIFEDDVTIKGDLDLTDGELNLTKKEDGVTTDILNLIRDSATPGDNDATEVYFKAKNDAAAVKDFAKFSFIQEDVSVGTEKGAITLELANGTTGALEEVIKFSPDAVEFAKDTIKLNSKTLQNLADTKLESNKITFENTKYLEISENITISGVTTISGDTTISASKITLGNTKELELLDTTKFENTKITLGNAKGLELLATTKFEANKITAENTKYLELTGFLQILDDTIIDTNKITLKNTKDLDLLATTKFEASKITMENAKNIDILGDTKFEATKITLENTKNIEVLATTKFEINKITTESAKYLQIDASMTFASDKITFENTKFLQLLAETIINTDKITFENTKTITATGSLDIEADSNIDQDVTKDSDVTFASINTPWGGTDYPIKFIYFDIGTWDMVSTTVKITSLSPLTYINFPLDKILQVEAIIYQDPDGSPELRRMQSIRSDTSAGEVYIEKNTGNDGLRAVMAFGTFFASIFYNDSTINRGRILIFYI